MKNLLGISKALAIAIGMVSVLGTTVLAANFEVKPAPYNPDNLNVTVAAAKVKGAGNPNSPVQGDAAETGWVLARNNDTGPSADLTVKFKSDTGEITVNKVGFDHLKGNTQCGAGSPRFNVELVGGGTLFLECDQGDGADGPVGEFNVTVTRTNTGDGWERILFDFSGTPANANFLQVLSDSGPGATLPDNIRVNGT